MRRKIDFVTAGTMEHHLIYECNECWYFTINKMNMYAHKLLHVKRGALYNCSQCVFNVTKAEVLYHHFRYGHMIEEPELKYPENSIIQAGYRDIYIKNAIVQPDSATETDEIGPPMVWSYVKESLPSFTRVFKCRYCPHTNRRRHNTIEHERMHSDHPNHQFHRQQQQYRIPGNSTLKSAPLHPCKRCTYVCNNAGVLASHVKVHSVSYGSSVVGFYDTSIGDSLQTHALEYVMELEQGLQLDNHSDNNGLSDSDSDTSSQEDMKYKEIDNPKLKFCPHCPARFFFHFDLRCHIRFHQYRGWKHSCNCCSFVTQNQSHITAHEIVHSDKYAKRTAEFLASGYRVSRRYSKPLKYPVYMSEHILPCHQLSKRKVEDMEVCLLETDGSQVEPDIKGPRNSISNTSITPLSPQDNGEQPVTKKQRCLTKVAVPVITDVTMKTITSDATMPPLFNSKANAPKSTSNVVDKLKNSYIRSFTCDKCPVRFFKATSLQYHQTLHGGTGLYKCRKCDYASGTYENLIRHECVHLDLPPREKVKQTTLKSISKSKINAKNDSALLSTQMEQTSNTTDSDNEKHTAVPEIKYSMLETPDFHYPIQYNCVKCPSTFDKHEQYAMHLSLHETNDKYKCDYSVRDIADCVQHQRNHTHNIKIEKDYKQVTKMTKLLKSRERTTNDQQTVASLSVDLNLHDTQFRNEISNRQRAYELKTAYGSVESVIGTTTTPFQCDHCPYESNIRAQFDQHMLHHSEEFKSNQYIGLKHSSNLECRFCTYRTHAVADLMNHTKLHFLLSSAVISQSIAAASVDTDDSEDFVENGNHIEYHGKLLDYHKVNENCSDGVDMDSTSNNGISEVEKKEPFFVFKDCGSFETIDKCDKNRYSPDCPPPPILIDLNDNRTNGDIKKKFQQKQTTAFVRIIDEGKGLEFLEDNEDSRDMLSKPIVDKLNGKK